MKLQRAQARGQAIIENAFIIPLLITGLSILFWSIRNAVLVEHMQNALRYQGEIVAQSTTYRYFTIKDAYLAARNQPDPITDPSNCSTPAKDLLAQTGTGTLNGVAIPRSQFWLAQDASATCKDIKLGYHGGGFTRDLLLLGKNESLNVTGNLYSQTLAHFIPLLQPSLSSQMTFFRTPNLMDLISCFPDIQQALKATLITAANPLTDSTSPFAATSANWSTAAPTNPLVMSGQCQTALPNGFTPVAAGPPNVPASVPGGTNTRGIGPSSGDGGSGGSSGGGTSSGGVSGGVGSVYL